MNKAKVSWAENVRIQLRDKNGKIKKLFQMNWFGQMFNKVFGTVPKIPLIFGAFVSTLVLKNLITTTGKAGLASRINGDGSEAVFTYIALGTGTTAANIADTTLETEISTSGGSRAIGAASRVTTTVTNDTARVSKTFTFTGSLAITEAGLLNAASVGVLVARKVFSVINVVDTDELVVTWDLSNA